MMSEFDKLNDIADVIDSLHKTPKYSETGQAMVRCTDIKYGKLDLRETFKVNEDVFAEFSRRYTPKEEDIIITRVGSYGITATVEDTDFCLGQNTSVIVPKGINSRYLYLALNSPFVKQQIEFSVVGAVQKTLSLKAINNLEIPRFEPEIEERIAKIGGELDDKIELNRQTNQTLEQIAQAIFKSWFVDFEPTRAKIAAKQKGGNALAQSLAAQAVICGAITLEQLQGLEEDYRGLESQLHPLITNKFPHQLAGLDDWTPDTLQTTADLFPDALVDSELGELPKGWEVKSLSEIIEVIGGGTPKRSEESYWGGDVPWFSVKDAPSHSDVFVVDTIEKISELGMQKSSTKLLPVGTTIITARGTVGKLALVGTPMCMNQSCYGIRGLEGFGPYFNYFNLREAITTLQRNTHGAVFDTITTQTFESYSMPVAAGKLVKRFEGIVTPILKKIEVNSREVTTLNKVRDALLPKLLSGELATSAIPEASHV